MVGAALDDGVLGSALELVEVAELERRLEAQATEAFSSAELAFARAQTDPARRLAARLAAKLAALRLLGPDLEPRDVEVVRGSYGPPALRLSSRAEERLAALGGARLLVSLTHERRHAAALVLVLEAA